jgi:hypothetical protein
MSLSKQRSLDLYDEGWSGAVNEDQRLLQWLRDQGAINKDAAILQGDYIEKKSEKYVLLKRGRLRIFFKRHYKEKMWVGKVRKSKKVYFYLDFQPEVEGNKCNMQSEFPEGLEPFKYYEYMSVYAELISNSAKIHYL